MARVGLLKAVVLGLDLIALFLGLVFSHELWIWSKPHLELVLHFRWFDLLMPNPFMPSGLALAVVWLISMRQVGLFDPDRMTSSAQIANGITRAATVVIVVVLVMQFLLPDRTYSRTLILANISLTAALIGLLRLVFFRLNSYVPKAITQQRVAIIGIGPEAISMSKRLSEMRGRGWQPAGFVMPENETQPTDVADRDILGRVEDIQAIVNTHDLQALVLATRQVTRSEGLLLATRANHMGLRVLQMPFTWGIATPRIDLARLGDLELIDLTHLAYPTVAEQLKRALDLLLVAIGGMLILPFLAIVAGIIKLQDSGPVFFIQQRVGRGGRVFPFFKFRSMVVNAEALRDQLSGANEADGVLFKMKNDPRITPFGHFIRKYSIDELPQIWNVVRGDMNLVGPRPLPIKDLIGAENDPEVAYWMELRQKVKPGITGSWQVSGRSDLGFDAMVNHDISYVQNWTLWLDILILLKTAPAVLKGRGAR